MTAVSGPGAYHGFEEDDVNGQWQHDSHNRHSEENFPFLKTPSNQLHSKSPYDDENGLHQLGLPQPRFHDERNSQHSSVPDSLIDLYRRDRTPLSTTGESAQNSTRSGTMRSQVQNTDESDRWIHRDKLAMIEIEELRAAGRRIPPELEAIERQQLTRQPSIGWQNHTEQEEEYSSYGHDAKRQKIEDNSEEADDGDEPFQNVDPRTPEEIAADPYEEQSATTYKKDGLRGSGSRIPLPKSSPIPINQQYIERSTPIPRKRTTSGNWEEDQNIVYPPARSRANSIGSAVLLDSEEFSQSPSQQASPTKARPAGKSPVPGAMLTSKIRTSSGGTPQNQRQTTPRQRTPSSTGRPGTSSGRPRTAINRPEGEAPWLATMYKPDPMLPQDQQIIPTHAKRLMQEQWEREGKPGSVFDQDFKALAVDHSELLRRARSETPGHGAGDPEAQTVEVGAEPQKTPAPAPSAQAGPGSSLPGPGQPFVPPPRTSSRRNSLTDHLARDNVPQDVNANGAPRDPGPGKSPASRTGSVSHAGYSTIPRVQSTPQVSTVPSPRIMENMEIGEKAGGDGTEEQKDGEEVGKTSKGCGCCIVM